MNELLIATSNWIRHLDKPRYPGSTCGSTTLNDELHMDICRKVQCSECIHWINSQQVDAVNSIHRVLK